MNYELIGLNPGNLRPLFAGTRATDSGVEAVTEAMRFASEAGEKIGALALALKANKDLSSSGRVKKFREEEPKLREPAIARLNAVKALMESKIKDSEHQMSAPPPSEDDAGLRRESNLIAAIRGMKPEQRSKLLDNLDDEVAGAILRSHHFAVGMTKSEQELFRITWQRRKYPDHVDQLARLNSGMSNGASLS
jgi:hypothetical protein